MWTDFLGELSPEDMVLAFAEKGWNQLELSNEHADTLLHRPDPPATGRTFRKFAADAGVTFPQGHLWLTCDIAAENQDEVIDSLKRWLDLFMAIDIRSAVLHPGGTELIEKGCDAKKLMETRLRGLGALLDHIKGSGTSICLENIPSLAPRADDLIAIIKASGSDKLGICLDTGHLNISGGSQAEFIHKAGPLLKALHLHDNNASGDQHLMPWGIGTIIWGEVFTALKEIGYSGVYNYEVPGDGAWARCPLPILLAKLDYLKAITTIMFDNA